MIILQPIISFLEFLYEVLFTPHCPQCENRIEKTDETCPHCGVNIKNFLDTQTKASLSEVSVTHRQKSGYVFRFAFYSMIATAAGIFLIGFILEVIVDTYAGITASPGSNPGAALIFILTGFLGAIIGLPVGAIAGLVAGWIDLQNNNRISKLRSGKKGMMTGFILAVIVYIGQLAYIFVRY